MSEIDEERIRKLIVLLRAKKNSNKQAALRELSKHKDNPLVVKAIVYTLGYPGNSGTSELAESIIMELGVRGRCYSLLDTQQNSRHKLRITVKWKFFC